MHAYTSTDVYMLTKQRGISREAEGWSRGERTENQGKEKKRKQKSQQKLLRTRALVELSLFLSFPLGISMYE